jgi:hypothetical protein
MFARCKSFFVPFCPKIDQFLQNSCSTMEAHNHEHLSDQRRRIASIQKAHERYEGALALWATWCQALDEAQCSAEEREYLHELKKKVDRMRQELRYKNPPC